MAALVAAAGTTTSSAQNGTYQIVVDFLSKDEAIRREARERLVESKDPSLLAALNDVLSFFYVVQDSRRAEEVVDVMEAIAGENVRGNPKIGWMKWIGRHDEIEPKPGYLGFKRSIFSLYDPSFREFFDASSTLRIRPEEIEWGGVKKDGIPALQNPSVIRARDASYLRDDDRVFGVYIDGVARAYPHRILDWHEMANDVVGETPITLSYCTLCGSGILYDGRVDKQQYTFGSSGLLYRSNKLMYDNQTRSLWSNLTGEPVSGPLAQSGIKLRMLPVVVTTWEAWEKRHPDTEVLDPDTGYERDYRESPYEDYFQSDETMFPVWLESDRLPQKDWVFALIVNGKPKAYPLDALKREGLVHDRVGGTELILVVEKNTGAVRAFESGGRRFTRSRADDELVEEGSAGRWRVSEEFLVDESGEHRLARLAGHHAFWFGWYAFFPSTDLYEAR